jgi:hypothetical protein
MQHHVLISFGEVPHQPAVTGQQCYVLNVGLLQFAQVDFNTKL